MSPDDIKTLRKELGCTAKELAAALGIDQATVLSWEKADLFPTKAYVDHMNALRAKGPSSIPKKAKAGASPMKVLSDPALWAIVRKMAVHKALRDAAAKLAENYSDPADD